MGQKTLAITFKWQIHKDLISASSASCSLECLGGLLESTQLHHKLFTFCQNMLIKSASSKQHWVRDLGVPFDEYLDLLTSGKKVRWRIQSLLPNPHVHLHPNWKRYTWVVLGSLYSVSAYLNPFFVVWTSKNVPIWICCWNLLASESAAPSPKEELKAAAAFAVTFFLLLLLLVPPIAPPEAFFVGVFLVEGVISSRLRGAKLSV